MLEPSNANAIYYAGYDSENTSRRGNHMGDTEAGTRAWMATIKAALKDADPKPTTYSVADKEYTLAVTVLDFIHDAAAPASQPVLLPASQPQYQPSQP